MRSTIALLLALAVLAAGVLWLALREGGEGRSRPSARGPKSREAEGASGEVPPAAPPRHPVYGIAAGDLFRYRFAERVVVDALPEPGRPPEPDIESSIAGTLVVRGYALTERGLVAGFSLEEALDIEMARETVVLLEPSGRVGPIAMDPGIGDESRRRWRSLLARWQVVRPGPGSTWTVSEEDTTGVVVVSYEAAGSRLSKRKLRYESLHGDGEALAEAARIDGGAEIEIDAMLRGARGREELVLHPPAERLLLRSEATFEFALEGVGRCGAGAVEVAERVARLAGEGLTTIGGREPAAPVEERIDLWAELGALEIALAPASADEGAELRALVRLLELARRDPAAVAALAQRLDDRPADEALAAGLLGVLGAAGTEAAQRALLDQIADPRRALDRRLTAVTAVAQVMEPTPALEEGLRALLAEQSDLGGSALLLLGAVAARVRDSDPARHERIVSELEAAASEADREIGERRTAFSALANAAPTKVPAAVESALASDDDLLRAAGAEVLARVGAPAAEARLLSLLGSDPSPEVRVAAAEALGSRPRPKARAPLLATAASDASEEVRLACLSALGSGPVGAEERRRLMQIAREDASEAVRNLAGRMSRGS